MTDWKSWEEEEEDVHTIITSIHPMKMKSGEETGERKQFSSQKMEWAAGNQRGREGEGQFMRAGRGKGGGKKCGKVFFAQFPLLLSPPAIAPSQLLTHRIIHCCCNSPISNYELCFIGSGIPYADSPPFLCFHFWIWF